MVLLALLLFLAVEESRQATRRIPYTLQYIHIHGYAMRALNKLFQETPAEQERQQAGRAMNNKHGRAYCCEANLYNEILQLPKGQGSILSCRVMAHRLPRHCIA